MGRISPVAETPLAKLREHLGLYRKPSRSSIVEPFMGFVLRDFGKTSP